MKAKLRILFQDDKPTSDTSWVAVRLEKWWVHHLQRHTLELSWWDAAGARFEMQVHIQTVLVPYGLSDADAIRFAIRTLEDAEDGPCTSA